MPPLWAGTLPFQSQNNRRLGGLGLHCLWESSSPAPVWLEVPRIGARAPVRLKAPLRDPAAEPVQRDWGGPFCRLSLMAQCDCGHRHRHCVPRRGVPLRGSARETVTDGTAAGQGRSRQGRPTGPRVHYSRRSVGERANTADQRGECARSGPLWLGGPGGAARMDFRGPGSRSLNTDI